MPADALPGSIADVNERAAQGRRRRGKVLLLVFGLLGLTTYAVDNRVNAAADHRARAVGERLVRATPIFVPDDIPAASGEVGARVSIRVRPALAMVADASYAWANRCVVRELGDGGRIYTERSRNARC
jgi:hypothetical protein